VTSSLFRRAVSTSRGRFAFAGVAVVAAVLSVLAIDPAGAIPPPGHGAPPPGQRPVAIRSAAEVANSLAYLEAQYGLSQQAALDRLVSQEQAVALNATLAQRFAGVYVGLWIDQRTGTVRVAATRPSVLATVVASVPGLGHYALSTATYSLADLNATAAALDRKLNGSARVAEVVADPTVDRVVVYQRAGAATAGRSARTTAALTTAERTLVVPDRRIASAVAASHGEAVVRQLVVGAPRSGLVDAATTCTPTACAAPLAGGYRLDVKRTSANTDPDNENPLWGECTNGFNLVDSSGTAYLMTAGHCMVGSDKTGTNKTYDNAGTQISTESSTYEYAYLSNGTSSYPVDYSIQPIANASTWKPAGQVLDFCWPGVVTSSSCVTQRVPITSDVAYASVVVGTVLCATGTGDDDSRFGYKSSGSAPGTRCGEVTSLNGGIRTDICSRKGDSGGPLFDEVSRTAYGILNDGTAGSGACPTSPPGSEWSQYSPVSLILARVNAQSQKPGFILG